MTTETTIEGIITPLEAHKVQEFNSLGMPIDIFYVREKSTEMTVAETRNEGLANLIARAPTLAKQNAELLEELENAADVMNAIAKILSKRNEDSYAAWLREEEAKARTAIAKAEGGEA